MLLVNEPLSNLDAKHRRHVRSEIRQIQQDLALTAVYVAHDQEEAMAVSDKIFVMKDGVIAQSGSPAEIYQMPNSEFLADFIGDVNIDSCNVISTDYQSALVEVNGVQLEIRLTGSISSGAKLAIHPQDVHL